MLQQHSVCADETQRPSAPSSLGLNCLVSLFNDLFTQSEETIVVGDANEPLYAPKYTDHVGIIELASDKPVPLDMHRIYFRHDYVSSLLHEVAHWCIAGAERRNQLDYGYWYSPDDRSQPQQKAFEKVEVKPQAIERLFSIACAIPFRVSADNLSLKDYDTRPFSEAVLKQSQIYMREGLPVRAEMFLNGIRRIKTPVMSRDVE